MIIIFCICILLIILFIVFGLIKSNPNPTPIKIDEIMRMVIAILYYTALAGVGIFVLILIIQFITIDVILETLGVIQTLIGWIIFVIIWPFYFGYIYLDAKRLKEFQDKYVILNDEKTGIDVMATLVNVKHNGVETTFSFLFIPIHLFIGVIKWFFSLFNGTKLSSFSSVFKSKRKI